MVNLLTLNPFLNLFSLINNNNFLWSSLIACYSICGFSIIIIIINKSNDLHYLESRKKKSRSTENKNIRPKGVSIIKIELQKVEIMFIISVYLNNFFNSIIINATC